MSVIDLSGIHTALQIVMLSSNVECYDVEVICILQEF